MIFIRLVDGGKNDDSRFNNAFNGVPDDKWSVFSNSNELPQKLYDDENPINIKDTDTDLDSDSLSNAIILSTSLLYKMLTILLSLLFTMAHV
jgi:hypothetical protein